MQSYLKFSGYMRHTLALTALLGASAILAGAQTAAPAKTLNLQLPAVQTAAAEPEFSSSVAHETATVETAELAPHVDFLNAMQYGGRRSGRPRYRGGNTTQDGVEKYTFFAGAGFTAPVGNDSNYLKTSYAFQVGLDRNFTKHASLGVQFDWDNFGFTGQTISNQAYYEFGDTSGNQEYGMDGSSHIWSFTINPKYNLTSGDVWGSYVVAGGGFYHKTATFTVPEVATGYDPYYGYYSYGANAEIDSYSSNSAGVNGGIGITYKFSRFANQKFYAEARVVHTFNQYRPGINMANAVTYTGYNLFPQNSQETTYFPVKFGIRF